MTRLSGPARGVAIEHRLERFDPACAGVVAGWVLDEREAYWLAPKTPPPVTAERVRSWSVPGTTALQLVLPPEPTPVAYGEVNVLNAGAAHYWLGHLIVDPEHRDRGIGRLLTDSLLAWAKSRLAAVRVSLIVFAENRPAIACYRSVGFRDDGWEDHYLPPYRGHVRLKRMTLRL